LWRPLRHLRASASYDPDFDIAWREEDVLNVVEVKSTDANNEVSQLRTGLGQVLEYRYRLRRADGGWPRAVLAVERQPARSEWVGVCAAAEVSLIWGPSFDGLLSAS